MCPTPKIYSNNFELGKVTQTYYLLCAKIYFPIFFQQNQNCQQVAWPPYDVIVNFAINSTVKLQQKQKCWNFDKNWYKDEILPENAFYEL